jgi:hypothetical protein
VPLYEVNVPPIMYLPLELTFVVCTTKLGPVPVLNVVSLEPSELILTK